MFSFACILLIMLSRVHAYLLAGIDALPCEVEVDSDDAGMNERSVVVGLPDAAVKESLERVKSAMLNSGYAFPRGRLLVNLAPADVRKEGPAYDLPIAVGMLMAQGVIRARTEPGPGPADLEGVLSGGVDVRRMVFAGELALDGRVRPVKGVIALATMARERGFAGVVVPAENAQEAALVEGLEVISARTLAEVVGVLNGALEPAPVEKPDIAGLIRETPAPVDFVEVRGQEGVKRAIVIAAAGAHNILMLGPPGSGKTMMAKALPGVLPPLTPAEALEITRIYSAAGELASGRGLIAQRPVRSPHHTASSPAIVGGGMIPRPGEISLAHHGVLFLDELAEFPRFVLETLRQPLEDHVITIARAHAAVRFPASFMLVAAMNPTPKGYMTGDPGSKRAMERYLERLSGPLLDRIDIHVEAPAVPFKELSGAKPGTTSAQMREIVAKARACQRARQGDTPNSRLTGKQLDVLAPMSEQARAMVGQALTELGLSARAYDKIRRVSRTIADLEGAAELTIAHVSEAVQYRLLDRNM